MLFNGNRFRHTASSTNTAVGRSRSGVGVGVGWQDFRLHSPDYNTIQHYPLSYSNRMDIRCLWCYIVASYSGLQPTFFRSLL